VGRACEKLGREIQARRGSAAQSACAPLPRTGVSAGVLPRCARQGFYLIRHWEESAPSGPDEAARLLKGKKEKLLALAELTELGFELTRAHIPFSHAARKRYGINGRLDAGLRLKSGKRTLEVPLAVKSMHPLAFAAVKNPQYLKKHPLYSNYYRQARACIQAFECNSLLLLLNDCLGHWKLLRISRDEEELRDIRRCVRAINSALKGGPLPPPRHEAKACARCAFRARCKASSGGGHALA